VQKRVPRFLIKQEPCYRRWGEALAIICTPKSPARPLRPNKLYIQLVDSQARRSAPAFLSSALLHFAVVFFLLRMPFSVFLADAAPKKQNARIVYELRTINLSAYLPFLRPPGPGGHPGRGTRPDKPPARGSNAFHPKLTIISNPPHPDNSRQTILQTPSPPDLKIPFEIHLPNILISSTTLVLMPPPRFNFDAGRIRVSSTNKTETLYHSPTPKEPAVPAEFALTLPPSPNLLPHLVVPAPPPAPSPEATKSQNTTEVSGVGSDNGTPGDTTGLLAVSVQSGPLTEVLALPPGNRYGAFSISPAGGQPGSPGGVAAGDPQGGAGGPGTGGNGSTGVGTGGVGGGGDGGPTGEVTLSITGVAGTAGVVARGVLPSSVAESRIYPVLLVPRIPRNALVITAGPVGGGGLRLYGVLQGDKIFTTYLPMPGKSWILQYCHRKDASSHRGQRSREIVAELEHGLIPPFAEEKFDFHRPPIPEEKADEMIILYGVIRNDGSVGELEVLQGVQAEADQAALAAFGRWKFRPALRAGKRVSVEILVGIPATGSGTEGPRTTRTEANPKDQRRKFPQR